MISAPAATSTASTATQHPAKTVPNNAGSCWAYTYATGTATKSGKPKIWAQFYMYCTNYYLGAARLVGAISRTGHPTLYVTKDCVSSAAYPTSFCGPTAKLYYDDPAGLQTFYYGISKPDTYLWDSSSSQRTCNNGGISCPAQATWTR